MELGWFRGRFLVATVAALMTGLSRALNPRLVRNLTAGAIVLLLCAPSARADFMAYSGSADLRAEGATLVVEHHHDWKHAKKRPSWVRWVDRASGREILRRNSPPLSTLWLSPDEQFLVGLSRIKHANEVQVFVMSRDGRFVHEEKVRCADPRMAGVPCSESMSNWVHWYDSRDPGIQLDVDGTGPSGLTFNTAIGFWCRPHLTDAASRARCEAAPRRATLRFARPGN